MNTVELPTSSQYLYDALETVLQLSEQSCLLTEIDYGDDELNQAAIKQQAHIERIRKFQNHVKRMIEEEGDE